MGYGYGGFWLGWAGESAQVWLLRGADKAWHAHNGLLNIWLDLGLLGVSVFVLGFLLAFRRAVAWARLTKTAEGLLPLVFLTFILLYNTTESGILSYNNITWILYVTMVLSMPVRGVRVPKTIYGDVTSGKRIRAKMARTYPTGTSAG